MSTDTDRELLEAAARAAGLKIHTARQAERDEAGHGAVGLWLANGCTCWNPLADDGDALRLAVALLLEVRQVHGKAHAGIQDRFWCSESWFPDGDCSAATRRAIVRAAAAIAQEQPCPKT